MSMRCWQCGVEPLETFDVGTLDSPTVREIPGRWPPGDHEHAERPPTAAELERAGHNALMRIRAEVMGG
jgi:hypothetical protein